MITRWLPNFSASCFHAAEAIYLGWPLADERLAAALAEPALRLHQEIVAAELPPRRFWRTLVALSATIENNRELATLALRKTIGGGARAESLSSRLEGRLAAVEVAVGRAYPKLREELQLRAGPLREQWEARGPGLLLRLRQLTEDQLLVPNADVVLVHPALGGGGDAHLPFNSVRIEAVLANPLAELPEVARLGWLLSQLNLDLPAIGERIQADRLPFVAQLAMLPPALLAAEHVELVRFSPDLLRKALSAWHIAVPPDVDAVAILDGWWQTYVEARPPFSVALAALDRMFG